MAARGLLTEGMTTAQALYAQFGRRTTSLTLAPFLVESDAGRRQWRRLLLTIEHSLVLADKYPGMLADDLSDYLYARSTGHFASLITLIARGCEKAIRIRREKLTVELMDKIPNDVAAEQARKELPRRDRGGAVQHPPRAPPSNQRQGGAMNWDTRRLPITVTPVPGEALDS